MDGVARRPPLPAALRRRAGSPDSSESAWTGSVCDALPPRRLTLLRAAALRALRRADGLAGRALPSSARAAGSRSRRRAPPSRTRAAARPLVRAWKERGLRPFADRRRRARGRGRAAAGGRRHHLYPARRRSQPEARPPARSRARPRARRRAGTSRRQPLLERTRPVARQAGLARVERRRNVRGAFAAAPDASRAAACRGRSCSSTTSTRRARRSPRPPRRSVRPASGRCTSSRSRAPSGSGDRVAAARRRRLRSAAARPRVQSRTGRRAGDRLSSGRTAWRPPRRTYATSGEGQERRDHSVVCARTSRRKLAKLDKQLAEQTQVELELSEEKNPSIPESHVAEATIFAKGPTLRAREASREIRASIDQLVDNLERQVKRYREKRIEEPRRRVPRHERVSHDAEHAGAPARVRHARRRRAVRRRQRAARPVGHRRASTASQRCAALGRRRDRRGARARG